MIVLAVDMSSARGTLALGEIENQKFEILGEKVWEKKAMHSDVATLELQSLLNDSGKKLSDLTHIAVNHGPGSFTGLRVGINLARTLAYALDLPILGASTLELLAFDHSRKGETVCVAVKALQTFIYAGIYKNLGDRLEVIKASTSIDVSDLQTFVEQPAFGVMEGKILADANLMLDQNLVVPIDPLTTATTLVQYLATLGQTLRFLSWKDITPLYIRASEPEEKMRRGLLKPV